MRFGGLRPSIEIKNKSVFTGGCSRDSIFDGRHAVGVGRPPQREPRSGRRLRERQHLSRGTVYGFDTGFTLLPNDDDAEFSVIKLVK